MVTLMEKKTLYSTCNICVPVTFAVSFKPETPNFGTFDDFFLIFAFKCVYAHI